MVRSERQIKAKIRKLGRTTFRYPEHAEALAGQIAALEWALGEVRTLADEYRPYLN